MGRHGFRLRCLLVALGLVVFSREATAIDIDGDFYCDEATPKAVLKLVSWRETKDCGGKKGWAVLVGRE